MLSYPKSVNNQSYKFTDKKPPDHPRALSIFMTYYFANILAPSQKT